MTGPEKSGPEGIGRSVVLGLDTSPGAQRALTVAIRLARSLDVPLVLVHTGWHLLARS